MNFSDHAPLLLRLKYSKIFTPVAKSLDTEPSAFPNLEMLKNDYKFKFVCDVVSCNKLANVLNSKEMYTFKWMNN